MFDRCAAPSNSGEIIKLVKTISVKLIPSRPSFYSVILNGEKSFLVRKPDARLFNNYSPNLMWLAVDIQR